MFPSCLQSKDVRRVKSTVNVPDSSNNNQNVAKPSTHDQTLVEPNSANDNSSKCVFYVSEDEDLIDGLIDKKSQRTIVKPSRRCRAKPKLELCCQRTNVVDDENEEDSEDNSNNSSPMLPWKKSFDLSPLPMCTPPALSSAVVPIKSSPTNSTSSDFSESSSSSNDQDTEDFSVKSLNHSPPIQDIAGGYHQIQPTTWEPHGALANSDLLNSEVKSFGVLQHSRSYTDRYIDDLQKSKIKKLSKQLSVVRKKIEAFEAHFEDTFGYRPSQAEKQNDKSTRKLMLQQNRLKRQIRLCRESGDSGFWEDDCPSPVARSDSPTSNDFASILNDNSELTNDFCEMQFEKVVMDLEKTLDKDRQESGRPQELNSMSAEQILEEKQSIQRVLNQFQDVLKRSTASEKERVVLRDLLQRYRSVKRLIRRSSNVLIKDPCELETIPEGSEIQLTLASPQHRICIEMNHPKTVKEETFVEDLPDHHNDMSNVEQTLVDFNRRRSSKTRANFK